jgi:hypothetical protein
MIIHNHCPLVLFANLSLATLGRSEQGEDQKISQFIS